jgi:hypothetical protein
MEQRHEERKVVESFVYIAASCIRQPKGRFVNGSGASESATCSALQDLCVSLCASPSPRTDTYPHDFLILSMKTGTKPSREY